MADKLIYISNDDLQNYPLHRLKRLNTQLNEPTNKKKLNQKNCLANE